MISLFLFAADINPFAKISKRLYQLSAAVILHVND